MFNYSEIIRKKLTQGFEEIENHFIVDSMPLEICKFPRHNRIKICKEDFSTSPKKGICASQYQLFYGYKIHAVCTFSGVITIFNLIKANVHDIHYLADVKEQIADCILIGDKGYLSASYQLDLFQTANIRLETPVRANQNNYKKQPYIHRKTRKKIETFFSQLCDQFMIRRIYAKSFLGFKTRILAKISALTLVQYINKFFFDRNINNIKIQII